MKTKAPTLIGSCFRTILAATRSALSFGRLSAAGAGLLSLLLTVHCALAETCCPDTGGVKWLQRPNLTTNGFDVNATFSPVDFYDLNGPGQWVVADDFRCTTPGYITDIHLWGSWWNDQVDSNASYTLTIWSDVPGGTSGFSHPGQWLWTQTFTNGQYTLCPYTNWYEYFYAGDDIVFSDAEGASTNLYYLCFDSFRTNFFQTGTPDSPMIYWLSVAVQSTNQSPAYFGWKSSADAYNDAAVYAKGTSLYPVNWSPMYGLQGERLNLAFKITTFPPICDESTNTMKYVQWPATNPPKAFDVWNSSAFPPGVTNGPFVLADDFVCANSGPITDIHLWGSWLNDQAASNSITFWLGMYDDVPIGGTNSYSHPGTLLYQQYFAPGQYAEGIVGSGQESFANPGPNELGTIVGTDTKLWYYCFYPTNFYQCGTSNNHRIYWLSVFAQLPNGVTNVFGWKTTTNLHTDVSVHAPWPGFGPPNVSWKRTAITLATNYVDLAFKINTSTNQCSPPQLICASNLVVGCDSNWQPPSPLVVDCNLCCPSNNPPFIYSVITNSSSCPTVIQYFWEYTNCLGQFAYCSSTVTVTSAPPTITCSSNKTVQCGTSWSFDQPTATSDCCPTAPTILTVSTVTNHAACPLVVTRTWKARDCCTNFSTLCSQTITVQDTTPPQITCPSNIVILTCDTNVIVTWSIIASDVCSSVTVTSSPPSGTAFPIDTTNIVVATAQDACGNSNSCSFTVTVLRAVSPILIARLDTDKVVLTWTSGILQVATNLLGPWLDLPSATSPYTNTVFPLPPTNRFYRLRCPVCVTAPSGLVSWWRAEGDATDVEGNHPGTLQNGATFAPGLAGQAFSFNGTNQYVQVPGYLNIVPSTELTVDFWQKVSSVKVQSTFSASALVNGSIFNAHIPYSDGNVYWDFGDINSGGRLIWSPPASIVGDWWHFALVASQSGNYMAIYTNGALAKLQNGMTPFVRTNVDLDIGGSASLGVSFGGLIDEFEIYNRALSALEITNIYSAGAASKCLSICTPAPSGLLAWWPGENNPNDIVSSINGTLINGATFAPGKVGNAFSFDGVDAYILVPDSPGLAFPSAFTIETWVKTSGTPDYSGVVEKVFESELGGNNTGFSLSFHYGGLMRCDIGNGSGGYSTALNPAVVTDGLWHHVAAVFTAISSTATLYVDGVAGPATSISGFAPSTSQPLYIGRDPAYTTRFFQGLLDEISIYNRALTATEIQAIYNAGAAGKCVTP